MAKKAVSYLNKTLGTRCGNTVFFKHKYLTMPTITAGDALLKTSIDLKDTIEKKNRVQDSGN